VVERQIDTILWHSQGQRIDIIYASGKPDRLMVAHDVACAFAQDVGLPLASSTKETVRWHRGHLAREDAE
jgi:hypothetical protein